MPSLRRIAVLALPFFVFGLAAAWMGQVNALGPFHRDGSHYLFMVINILDGQAPYWAQFETKNPGLELFWTAWHALFGGGDVVRSARHAEASYVAVTGAFVAMMVLVLAREVSATAANRLVDLAELKDA